MNLILNQRLQQPKALYLLFAVKMWECFSFYGMRALMVLYLVNQLGTDDRRAYGIYALYGALVEFGGILGGYFADRLLGLRKSIIYGGWLIAAGHIFLSIYMDPWAFFIGLAFIVVGTGLFNSNISALLSLFYEENDPRRELGFTLYYVGINVGALLASILCGVIGETYGWHYGFGLAAIGMIAGNVLFISCRKWLEGKGELLNCSPKMNKKIIGFCFLLVALPMCALMIAWEHIFLQIMPYLCLICVINLGRKMVLSGCFSKEILIKLAMALAALALFFAAEDQTASALLVFSDRYATKTVAGFIFPTTLLLSINPFVIIVGGFMMSKLHINHTSSFRLVIAGLLLAAAVFVCLTISCWFPNSEGLVPLETVAVAISVISMGEVLLAPAIFSYCSEVAPKQWLGATMGLLPLGFSFGNMLSGFFSQAMVVNENVVNPLTLYGEGFIYIALLLGSMAVLILVGQHYFNFKQKKLAV